VTKSVFTTRYRRLCKLLLERRESAGLTQAALARKLGRPQSFVSKYERAERRLDLLEFLEIADALGFEPTAIIEKIRETNGKRPRRRPADDP
jgi:transcriptional regulator with XRE-family HTH domain